MGWAALVSAIATAWAKTVDLFAMIKQMMTKTSAELSQKSDDTIAKQEEDFKKSGRP